jgi:hypothetical protein
MREEDEFDDVTDQTVAQMRAIAEDIYDHRGMLGGDVLPSEPVNEVRSVVSVRFHRSELDDIASAAALAGLPVSTYIRNAALAAAGTVDLEAARRELHTAARALTALGRKLDPAMFPAAHQLSADTDVLSADTDVPERYSEPLIDGCDQSVVCHYV